MTFDELGLSPNTLKAVAESGYTEPTPIQAGAIPKVLQREDVLGIAQTGTGKTASFTLPMIDILSQGKAKARMPRSLIIEPTRELAAQVAENFEKYGKYHRLNMALLIGGVSFGDQDKALMRGVDVLIATPGRLLDQYDRGKILMSGVQLLVIDEADRMLDMGFIPDIERIFKMTPFTRQTLFFSATMPTEIKRIVDTFLHNPARVEVARPAETAKTVSQYLLSLKSNDPKTKRAKLRQILTQDGLKNAILFCNRKRDVDIVAKSLTQNGINAAPIHGDLNQSVRTETLERFKSGDVTVLVASDVAARGLDIPDVSHVVNFDVPFHAEDYVHRIGRTGRAGRKGTSITIATPVDAKALAAVTEMLGKPIPAYQQDVAEQKPVTTEPSKPKTTRREPKKSRPVKAAKQPEPVSRPATPVTTKTNTSGAGFAGNVPDFFLKD
ncbi:ATP-dependent RNA helicase Atu1833 [hydrothermal vent metagenome]|uniref:ATP-dependent RNA helicase Atu1833 n=1 Tax=hydrothermal vent metagenome TaxID=652676 RepID=A0A3B0RL45_9ZZZZ